MARKLALGMAAALAIGVAIGATSASSAPPAPVSIVDPTTGHRIVKVDDRPGNYALYFNYNAFTPDGARMVYLTPEGIRTAHVGDWTTKLVLKEKVDRLLFVAHRSPTAYYTTKPAGATEADEPYTVWAVNLDTGKRRKIADMPNGRIESINADDTLLSGNRELAPPPPAIAAQGRRDPKTGSPNYTGVDEAGRPLSFADAKEKWMGERLHAAVPMEIFTIDTATGARKTVHKATDWLNHVQFSPTDPTLLMFCHEGPWHEVDRIWTIRTDGSALTKIHQRTMQAEIAGHEFWSPDGSTIWYDLQAPKGAMPWLASYDVKTGARRWYKVEANQTSVHFNISPDGKIFGADGNGTNKYMSLLIPKPDERPEAKNTLDRDKLIATGTLVTEHVVDMAKQDYTLEPNLHFTPDGKWLVYRANVDGSPAIYAAEIAKAR